MEGLTLLAFCAVLIASVLTGFPLVGALAAGLAIFLAYGLLRGYRPAQLGRMCLSGVWAARNILINLILIGVLTAVWRACGAIPVIVGAASRLIRPSVFLLMTYLLCGGVSSLTGTAFGTAATMGVICATVGRTMGVDIRLTGGAVLSGIFIGDRCSPVSTSALLVSELTGTDLYGNIRRMLRSALVPFLAAGCLYALIGVRLTGAGEAPDLMAVFSSEFRLSPVCALPAALILVLAAFRVRVKPSLLLSIAAAVPTALLLQGIPAGELARAAWSGFKAGDAATAAYINGGGIASMLRVACIVCLSSAFSGIFRGTGLLDGEKRLLRRFSARTGPFLPTLFTSLPASMLACNQTLAVMLTHQLCGGLYADRERLALDLEDTVIVLAPIVPWSVAGGAPLASVGAPAASIAFAFYLFLLPLWRLVSGLAAGRKEHA